MPYIFLMLVCVNALYLGISIVYKPDASAQKVNPASVVKHESDISNN